jgi:hypothetical protein
MKRVCPLIVVFIPLFTLCLSSAAVAEIVQLRCAGAETLFCNIDASSRRVSCSANDQTFFTGTAEIGASTMKWTQPGPPVVKVFTLDRYSGLLTIQAACLPGYCQPGTSSATYQCEPLTPGSRKF